MDRLSLSARSTVATKNFNVSLGKIVRPSFPRGLIRYGKKTEKHIKMSTIYWSSQAGMQQRKSITIVFIYACIYLHVCMNESMHAFRLYKTHFKNSSKSVMNINYLSKGPEQVKIAHCFQTLSTLLFFKFHVNCYVKSSQIHRCLKPSEK